LGRYPAGNHVLALVLATSCSQSDELPPLTRSERVVERIYCTRDVRRVLDLRLGPQAKPSRGTGSAN
jgi:hypothetical protein